MEGRAEANPVTRSVQDRSRSQRERVPVGQIESQRGGYHGRVGIYVGSRGEGRLHTDAPHADILTGAS